MKEISGSINNGIPKRLLSILFNNNIYVSSSLSESFGLTILEAMAMGLSIIATDTIGSKELVENGKNGFIVPKSNPTIMANQILKLINDSDLQKKFGKKSLLKARKLKYSWNNIALEHTNLYKKLIFDFKRKKK